MCVGCDAKLQISVGRKKLASNEVEANASHQFRVFLILIDIINYDSAMVFFNISLSTCAD